jgi:chemotaxis protein methyltransferase WspC
MRAPSRAAKRPTSVRSAARATPAVIAAPTAAPVVPSADPAVDLDAASRLADRGQFAEAAERCEAHVRRWGPSATAFYLLGLVSSATGRRSEAAITTTRKSSWPS